MQSLVLRRWLLGSAAAATGLGSSYVGFTASQDPGFRRSAYFWYKVMPIYLHYRIVELMVKGKSDEEQNAAFEPLHDMYAARAVAVVEELKGFYIKIAQIGSTRADFLPKQYLTRVMKLQDDCPKVDFSVILDTVEKSLGGPATDTFEYIDERPLGAASIGQAHRARLKGGREVVIKVMLPDSEDLFKGDMKTIKAFCKLAQPEHLVMLDEVEKQFKTEFDYRREGQNLNIVRQNIMPTWSDRVVIPAPIFATKQVLVMDYIKGVKLVDGLQANFDRTARLRGMTSEEFMKEIQEKEARGEKVQGATSAEIERYSNMIWFADTWKNFQIMCYNSAMWMLWGNNQEFTPYVKTEKLLDTEEMMHTLFMVHGHQVFVDGSFNGDPHPGNILLTDDGRIGLIDYGQVKHMPREDRVQLSKLFVALAHDDKDAVVREYTEMGFRTKYMNPEVIYQHCCVFFNIDDFDTLGGTNIQTYLEKLQALDPMVSIADKYLMAGRAALLLRGLGYALKYKIKAANVWEPFAVQLLREEAEIHGNPPNLALRAQVAAREANHARQIALCAAEPQEKVVYFSK